MTDGQRLPSSPQLYWAPLYLPFAAPEAAQMPCLYWLAFRLLLSCYALLANYKGIRWAAMTSPDLVTPPKEKSQEAPVRALGSEAPAQLPPPPGCLSLCHWGFLHPKPSMCPTFDLHPPSLQSAVMLFPPTPCPPDSHSKAAVVPLMCAQ